MADLNVTTASVAALTAPTGSQIATVTARGIAGATISPGQVVYADPSANNLLKLAQANSQLQASNIVGIALGSASVNQPLTYAISGDVVVPTTGANTTLTSGSVYVLSAGTAGNMIATGDAGAPASGSGNFASAIGIGNGTVTGTTSIVRLNLMPAALRL